MVVVICVLSSKWFIDELGPILPREECATESCRLIKRLGVVKNPGLTV